MNERGGVGLGLAEPDLRVVYIIAGGAASYSRAIVDVGDCVVGVNGNNVVGMRLKEVSLS